MAAAGAGAGAEAGGGGATGAGAAGAGASAAGAGAGVAGAGAAGGVDWAVSAAGAGPLLHPPRSSKPAKDNVLTSAKAAGLRAVPRLVWAALEKACLIIVLSIKAKFICAVPGPVVQLPATFGFGDPGSVSFEPVVQQIRPGTPRQPGRTAALHPVAAAQEKAYTNS